MRRRSRLQLLAAGITGVVVAVLVSQLLHGNYAPSLGWDAAAVIFLVLRWRDIWPLDAEQTKNVAADEDSGILIDDIIIILAALVSLVTVALVLTHSGDPTLSEKALKTFLGVISVVLAWIVLHTVYTLRYARLYYSPPYGGIEFNGPAPPTYADFAYVAFSVGMTFQVSDTNLTQRRFRTAVLAHALLSFIFVTTILAVTINLVAGING
jgi:uncharacterized membrane protein